MTREEFDNLPKPKYKPGEYITDGEGQSFSIDFVAYDFDREEYYYYPSPDTYAGKIYEGKAQPAKRPKSPAEETYEILFGKNNS